MEKKQYSRKNYLDLIRICAILMVLYNHRYTYRAAGEFMIYNLSSCVYQLLATLCRCGVPLFLMVSGTLLLGKEESCQEILKKRILRILIVMVLCTLMRAAGDFSPQNLMNTFFTGLNWYLYAYLDYLLMLPFLRKIAVNTSFELARNYIWIVAAFYTMQGVISGIGGYTGILDFAPLFNTSFASLCWSIVFTLTGYWLVFYGEKFRKEFMRVAVPAAVVSLALSVFFVIRDFQLTGGENQEALRLHFIFFPSCVFFIGCKELGERTFITQSETIGKLLFLLSGASFGIFILETHGIMESLPWNRWEQIPGFSHVQLYLLGILSIFIQLIVCFGITWVLKKIPGVRKIL